MHTAHELQFMGTVSATVPLVLMVSRANSVTALDAAALPWTTDSSIGLG